MAGQQLEIDWEFAGEIPVEACPGPELDNLVQYLFLNNMSLYHLYLLIAALN